MQNEHREYNLQNLPLDRMNCARKDGSTSAAVAMASTTGPIKQLTMFGAMFVSIVFKFWI